MSPAGARVLVVEHAADGPAGWVGRWLVEEGCVLDVRRPYAGDPLPASLDEHDALLVLGGDMGADDDAEHPWLTDTKALVRRAAHDGVPTLGICLGHQLCAVALGGRVVVNPRGQQLGLTGVGWREDAAADPLLGAVAAAAYGVHWNDDVVLELPPGGRVLATAPGGEVQAARFAPSVWGVQLHPEVDRAALEPWAEQDAGPARAAELAAVLDAVDAAHDRLQAGWRPLATSLAGLARRRHEQGPRHP